MVLHLAAGEEECTHSSKWASSFTTLLVHLLLACHTWFKGVIIQVAGLKEGNADKHSNGQALLKPCCIQFYKINTRRQEKKTVKQKPLGDKILTLV